MPSREEIIAQVALGTYDEWKIKIEFFGTYEDPPGLTQLKNDHLPLWERWSDHIRVRGTIYHIRSFKFAIAHIFNPRYQTGFDFHHENAPLEYFDSSISAERWDKESNRFRRVRL